jgi:hypothetical protein
MIRRSHARDPDEDVGTGARATIRPTRRRSAVATKISKMMSGTKGSFCETNPIAAYDSGVSSDSVWFLGSYAVMLLTDRDLGHEMWCQGLGT